MRLVKIKYRNPRLDTEICICINNQLWNKSKIKIINNGTEMLVPKYYCPQHVGRLESQRKANKKYRAAKPLKIIKQEHERITEKRKNQKRNRKPTDRIYKFNVSVNAGEYKLLWNYLYKDLRNPLEKGKRAATIEELQEKRGVNEKS